MEDVKQDQMQETQQVTEIVDEQVQDTAVETDDVEVDDSTETSDFDDEDVTEDDGGDDDAPEAFESEEDFLSQYKLPGNPKTLHEALTMTKELVNRLNRVQQQDAEKQIVDTPKEDAPKSQEFFPRNVFTKQFERLIEDGQIQGDNVGTYKYLGKVMDQAINSQTEMVENAMSALVTEIARVRGHLRDSAWRRFEAKNKGLVDRERLDKIMDSMGYYDYGKAFRQLAVDDPSLLKQIEKRAEQRAVNKQNRGLARFTNPRRDKQEPPKKVNVRAYLTPDGQLDKAKLAKLDSKDSDAIVDTFYSGKF